MSETNNVLDLTIPKNLQEHFTAWLTDMRFYIGYARYMQFGLHAHVCVTVHSPDDELNEVLMKLTDELNYGDPEGPEAGYALNKMVREKRIVLTQDQNPIAMMEKMMRIIEKDWMEMDQKMHPERHSG